MELTDILSKEEWAAFEKELYDRFKINCTVYNTDGVGVTGKPNWCNRLCPEIKANKDSLAAICAPGNQNFMAQAEYELDCLQSKNDGNGLAKKLNDLFFIEKNRLQDIFLGIKSGWYKEYNDNENFLSVKRKITSPELIFILS